MVSYGHLDMHYKRHNRSYNTGFWNPEDLEAPFLIPKHPHLASSKTPAMLLELDNRHQAWQNTVSRPGHWIRTLQAICHALKLRLVSQMIGSSSQASSQKGGANLPKLASPCWHCNMSSYTQSLFRLPGQWSEEPDAEQELALLKDV